MNNKPRFVRKHLATLIAAGLIGSAHFPALANDFTIQNGLMTVSNGTFSQQATVGTNGIVETITGVPVSNSFGIPTFQFSLVNSAASPTDGTFNFKVGVAINDQNSNRRFEAYLGTLTLTVTNNGQTVTGSIPNQDLVVLARDGSINASATLNNASSNGPVSINGGQVTFSGQRLVDRLTSANATFSTILDAFDSGGQYTYRVVIEQTSGSSNTRFGRTDGGTFTPFARVQTTCTLNTASQLGNIFDLLGVVNSNTFRVNNQFSSAYAVQGMFSVSPSGAPSATLTAFTETCTDTGTGGGDTGGGGTPGGGTGDDDDDDDDPVLPDEPDPVVNDDDVAAVEDELNNLDDDVDNLLQDETSEAPPNLVTSVTNVANTATNQTTQLIEQVDPDRRRGQHQQCPECPEHSHPCHHDLYHGGRSYHGYPGT